MKTKIDSKTRQKIQRVVKRQAVTSRPTTGFIYDSFTQCVLLLDRRMGSEKLANRSDSIRYVYSDRAHLYDRLVGRSIRRRS